MSRIKKFPSTEFHVIHSLVNKGVSFEDTDKVLAIQFYKESIKLLIDLHEKNRKELISVKSMNHVLWVKLRAERKRLKEDSSHAEGSTRAEVND